jgi:hypothetical protein
VALVLAGAERDEPKWKVGRDEMGAGVVAREPVNLKAGLRQVLGTPGRARDDEERSFEIAVTEAPALGGLGAVAAEPLERVGVERKRRCREIGGKRPRVPRRRRERGRPWRVEER